MNSADLQGPWPSVALLHPPLQSEKSPSCSFGCGRTHQEEYLKIPNLSLCPASAVSPWLVSNLQRFALSIPQERHCYCLVNLSHREGGCCCAQREEEEEEGRKSLGSSIIIWRFTGLVCKRPLLYQMPKEDFPSRAASVFFIIFIFISLQPAV